ncbi:MAG: Na/Pi cotransporter family protein [Gemmobacter sp.]
MTAGILTMLGGIGLFLFGMKAMTDALREAAGESMRGWLARITTTPLRGVATGAAVTAAIQSSSATTVMTIGFVGAGLLSFPQALGVIYGANIGTTVTGWIVNFLGFKLQLGQIALPALFVTSLMALLAGGQTARVGRGLSGLCLLFIGIDMMQTGMADADDILTPDTLPGDTILGRIQLASIGFAVTVLTQSSSAGVAMALVLLGSGSITFAQAAAMVIGMNLGTTVKGFIAALGGGRESLRAALANLLFNGATAILAFPLLDLVTPLLHATLLGSDDQTALVLFHTAFNLAGTMLFLPFTHAFAQAVMRLVPERREGLAARLDPVLLSEPPVALGAAEAVAHELARNTARALSDALGLRRDLRGLSALPEQNRETVAVLEEYLARIPIPPDRRDAAARYSAILHLLDHVQRMTERAAQRPAHAAIAEDRNLHRPAQALAAMLDRLATGRLDPDQAQRVAGLIERRARQHRRATLLAEHAGMVTVSRMFDRTDAMRWLVRTAHHAERMAHYIAAPAPSA